MIPQLLDTLAVFFALLALGAHATVPPRLAGSDQSKGRALWAQAALPLLLGVVVLGLARARLQPHPFVAAGLLPVGPSPVTTAALVGLGTLALVDLFVILFHGKLEPLGWRVLGVLGILAMVAWSAFEEAARIGSGPPLALGHYLTNVVLRSVIAGAAGLLVFCRPRPTGAKLAGLSAAAAAVGLWFLIPPIVQRTLNSGGDPLTLVAGALLVAGAPFVPARFRRLSALFGCALVALFLARAGAASEQIGLAGRVAPPLP